MKTASPSRPSSRGRRFGLVLGALLGLAGGLASSAQEIDDLPDIADALRARQRIVQAVCVAG